ncbi:hypothetical protein EJ05DRAFT_470799 [Pseudovirgaria hyperparasitica]|uniref:Uncharacterized protein n=1 Tax=Pseudovirgaria hyperparasitica TaxID=470096 RepID=A0A6A6VTF2_9PEZI|nr:uncharacterized protein EJ05DRAFT_470799 [Pseudovirgaria hyperparasitica]KAF2753034.1 hypothetical protein EJ05DRAFT_470799 [Pseudovirgaria hyperparasitica]
MTEQQMEEDEHQIVTVNSPEQLAKLLHFQQDTAVASHDLKSAKGFLQTCLATISEATPTGKNVDVFSAYLERQFAQYQSGSKDDADKPAFLPDVFQTWNLAVTNSNDRLFALSTRVLRLILQCISNSFDLSRFGAPLCRTLLQYGNLKTVSRGMSSVKLSVSSPCLQLMTELVTFDGGAFARQVFLKREWTFDSSALSRKLGYANRRGENETFEKVRESIRSDAIRYVLAHLKFQPAQTQIEILKLGNVVRPMFDHLISDTHDIAMAVLDTVRESVLRNKGIPRSSKSFLLTDRVLSNVAKLYHTESHDTEDSAERNVHDVAHSFLLLACTSAQNGTLYDSWGWYYRKREDIETSNDQVSFPLMTTPTATSLRGHEVHPRNTKLASFLQTLRPWASNLEQDLTLAIFESCPELMADYFLKKSSFQFDPKLTATWIGYASFMYASISLPVPKYFGRTGSYDSSPPQLSVILENLLPSALNQAVLTRCLNQSVELITFFAVRILIIALEKLETVLKMFEEACLARNKATWEAAGQTLVYEFCQRCPKMKDAVAVFFKSKPERQLEREAITRLLALYYRVVPLTALEENLDVSKHLTEILKADPPQDHGAKELKLLELGHLLNCARWSLSMNWFKKGEGSDLSPFTALLKIVAGSSSESDLQSSNSTDQIRDIVASVARDNYFLQSETDVSSCEALVLSIAMCPGQRFLSFLDDCIARHVKRPIKYWDDLETLKSKDKTLAHAKGPLSMIWMTIYEQSSFLRDADDILIERAAWIARFSLCCKAIGENATLIDASMHHIAKSSTKTMRTTIKKTLRDASSHERSAKQTLIQTTLSTKPQPPPPPPPPQTAPEPSEPPPTKTPKVNFTFPPPYDQDHPALTRAPHKDIEALIADADLPALILYLSSPDLHIRIQAHTLLSSITSALPHSPYQERTQLALLLGELLETANSFHTLHSSSSSSSTPSTPSTPALKSIPALPFTATQFAAHALPILADPTHPLYPKLNSFLNREPAWHIPRLPSYWLRSAVLNIPSSSSNNNVDDYDPHREITWVLDYLIDALASTADLRLCFRKGVFERVCALYGGAKAKANGSATAGVGVKGKVLRLLWRATGLEGGSDLLVTRYAVLGWVRGMRAGDGDGFEGALGELEERIVATCSRERIGEWSHGTVVVGAAGVGVGEEMDVD